MNIQFIVHSKSGNSLQVADSMKSVVNSSEHSVVFTHVQASNEQEIDLSKVVINAIPDSSASDLIVMGGPVRGFAASPALLKAINTLSKIQDKKFILFTTEFFPFDWMGGKRAMDMLEKAIVARGGTIVNKSIIHWNRNDRKRMIEALGNDLKSRI